MPLELLHPANLIFGILALPMIGLYYWTLRRQREDVATIVLWNKALARRSPWSKWRRLVSLAWQLGALALLVGGLLGPDFSPAARRVRTLAIVVDASASMQGSNQSPVPFQVALVQARRLVADLGRGERAAILSAAAAPRIHCGLTDDKNRLRQALDALACTDEPGELEFAAELGRRIVGESPHGSVVVFTDGRLAGTRHFAARPGVELRVVGGSSGNLAITGLAARPSPVDDKHEVLVSVANNSPESKSVTVGLLLGETRLESLSLELAPNSRAQGLARVSLDGPGLLSARLEPGDAFPADDTAWALVGARRKLQILLVGSENTPLAAALRAIPGLGLQIVADANRPLPQTDVTVLDGATPREMPAGGIFAVAPSSACDLWDVTGVHEGHLEARRPSGVGPLATIDLSGVVMEDLVGLHFKTPSRTLVATTSGRPLVSALERPSGNVLVWHGQLDKSDLTQRPQFPLLVAEAVRWLAEATSREGQSFRTGEQIRLPADKQARTLVSPHGTAYEFAANTPAFATLDQAGAWKLTQDAAGPNAVTESVLPVNLFSETESNLQAGDSREKSEGVALGLRFDEPLWVALLALALVGLLVDWYLLHRRVFV